ncbi:MAG: FG-GAP repeat domain-containing protein [Sphingorhabdus lacus]
MDLGVGFAFYDISWYRNRAAAGGRAVSFERHAVPTDPHTSQPTQMIAADIDGDNDMDLVIALAPARTGSSTQTAVARLTRRRACLP